MTVKKRNCPEPLFRSGQLYQKLQIVFKVFAVGGNDFFIPVEGFFRDSSEIFEVKVAAVDIDKAIPFVKAFMSRDQVDCRPWAVSHHLHAVVNRQLHLFDMPLEIFDPVVVTDGAVFFQLVMCAETIFGDNDRQAVTGINLVEGIAEADRVDFPAPFGLE